MLGMKMAPPALLLPKVQGVARGIAYFLLTLGMKMALSAFSLPKVQGWSAG